MCTRQSGGKRHIETVRSFWQAMLRLENDEDYSEDLIFQELQLFLGLMEPTSASAFWLRHDDGDHRLSDDDNGRRQQETPERARSGVKSALGSS